MKTNCITRTVAVIGMTALFHLPANAVSPGETLSREQIQSLYTNYLAAEGYRPEADIKGFIRFKREGRSYVIGAPGKDLQYFSVILPNVWKIESEAERSRVLAAADYANGKTKVCKITTVDDSVWVCLERFVAAPKDFEGVFKRSLSAMDAGVAQFVEKMRQSPGQ
jgi:hypothetical protein